MNARICRWCKQRNVLLEGRNASREIRVYSTVAKRLEGRRSNFPRRLSVSAASIPGGSARYEGLLLTRAGFLASFLLYLVSAGVC